MQTELPFIDEHEVPVEASPDAVWQALLKVVGRPTRGGERFARLLGCAPSHASPRFSGTVGDAVPGFQVEAAEPGHLLELRGRHRFARYALTFLLDNTTLRARTNAEFPGLKGKLYRALVIGSGGHALIAKSLLRRIARRAERGVS